MFNPIHHPLTPQEKNVRIIIIWIGLIITALVANYVFLSYTSTKFFSLNATNLNLLKQGDLVLIGDKKARIEEIEIWDYSERVDIKYSKF